MYIFHIKNEGPQLDILVTRALLGLSAFACIFFGNLSYRFIDYLLAAILLLLAVGIRGLIFIYRINRVVVLVFAALLLFIGTGSVFFAAILLLYGILIKFFYPKNVVEVGEEGVLINKSFSNSVVPWSELNNLVLKDNLLTLDFNNNKLLQLSTLESQPPIAAEEFNGFCKMFLLKNVSPGI
ncbi:MAG: hypothetical protein V4725_17470 [Bacteroidota bacterium]